MSAESMLTHDPIKWRATWRLEKYWGDDIGPDAVPYDVIEREGNLLMHGGASALWQMLIGNGTASAGQPLTYFNAANAYLGVGDSTTAAAATQTDLQATTNKLRKAMDSSFPAHGDGTASTNATIVFRSTFASGDANFAWNEWGIFNGASGGRMLNRKVEALGTKTSAAAWTLSVALTLA
ncbi:hypothetical protein AB0L65_20665 [Nonomuraea sp. NPDC052116]|uniref:hypothetical protein n=1 Tax=Nonomuraea sp. NPDC052116 TaxID=3155665 RepID=UPI003444DC0A